MFKKEHVSEEGDTIETVIGPSVKVEGDFISEGNIIIEGCVEGSITTSKHLRVGEHATIKANIATKTALIAGKIVGNIAALSKLEILASAHIAGDITTAELSLERGAFFTGHCTMTEQGADLKPPREQKDTGATEERVD